MAEIPRRVQQLIDGNPKMIVTGLPLLQAKEEKAAVAYDPSHAVSLKDVSCSMERVSPFGSGRFSSRSTATSSVSTSVVQDLQGANVRLQPLGVEEP